MAGDFNNDFNNDFDVGASVATATIIKDSGPGTTRNVSVEFSDADGFINVAHVKLAQGVDAQAWGDAIAARKTGKARRAEMEAAIAQCMAGTAPGDVVRTRIALPKLWETITRRLHNGPRNGMEVEEMRGLAQHLVGRGTQAIRSDLKNVRTAGQVNALKTQWQALLDADVMEYDEVDEED